MKVGDLVKFKGSWADGSPDPRYGIVTEVWANGRTRKKSSADIIWGNGNTGNILVRHLEVINVT